MAHDSSLPPGSILLRTMPLIVPRYGGALLFMAVHARCSDRSSVLSLFSPPPSPSLSRFPIYPAFPRSSPPPPSTFEIVELKKKKWKNRNEFFEIIAVRDVGYPNRCYLNSFLMMLNHPLSLLIDLVRVSEIALPFF